MLLIIPKYYLWFNCPQLGILYIASNLKKAGHEVSTVDFTVSTNSYSLIDKEIDKHELVGITANVSQACSGREIAKYIREKYPSKKIVWGGPYPSAEYEKLIPELADAVVIGEGETQAVDIANGTPFKNIQSLAFYENGKVVRNERINYIEILDNLPFPAWDTVNVRKYNFPGKIPGYLIQTQRGCPFKCSNCTTFIHGTKYRTRSIESVLTEIEWLIKDFKAKELHFWDDNFTLDANRVKILCEKIIRKNLKIRMTLPNGIRADVNDPEMFRLMRHAGFYYVNLAIESADQSVINKLGKRLDLTKVNETLDSLIKYDFRVGLLFMMGMPFDTKESLVKTVEFASATKAHHAHFFVVTPFPGTELYEIVKKNSEKFFDYGKTPINFDVQEERFINSNLSNQELKHYHRLAYQKFYSPARIIKMITKMIRDGGLLADFHFLLNCGVKILINGHR